MKEKGCRLEYAKHYGVFVEIGLSTSVRQAMGDDIMMCIDTSRQRVLCLVLPRRRLPLYLIQFSHYRGRPKQRRMCRSQNKALNKTHWLFFEFITFLGI